jgi:hypothetical protein
VLEFVKSLETFPFVQRHYTEIANVRSLALVDCPLPNRILLPAMFILHTLPEDMLPHITRKLPRGGPHEAYVGCELRVKVALSLCLIVFVRPGSHL